MHHLVDFSLRNRFLVLACTLLAAGLGVNSMLRLPIDAVPDVTPNQVMVLTQAPGIAPAEVEQFVTVPVETALSGLPGITAIRSVSRFGLSSTRCVASQRSRVRVRRRTRRCCSSRASRSASSRQASAAAASTAGFSPATRAASRSETSRPRLRRIA